LPRAADGLSSFLTNGTRKLDAAVVGFAGIFELILTWVILGYLRFDAPRISQGLLWRVAPGYRATVLRFWRQRDPLLRRHFIGIALVVVYACAAAYIGLGLFLGLHHALLLALLTGLLELLSVIGPLSSAVLAGLVTVHQAAAASAILAFIAYAIALRLSIDQFFGPLVLGKAAHMRPRAGHLLFSRGRPAARGSAASGSRFPSRWPSRLRSGCARALPER
jgi:predicted PurR-regulated permease PerM